ncbi:MAG: phosphate ABC transporter permease PstA [Bacteroidota bacterium]
MKIRKIEEHVFKVLMILSTLSISLTLIIILASIFQKGLPSLSWDMITMTPKGGFYFGKEGGILNAILGSVYLAFGATFLAFITGIPVALYMNIYLKKRKKVADIIRFFLDVLWGVPSIVYGAFGFAVMVFFGIRTSLLAGILTVTLFILPIMIRAIDEALKSVPAGLAEASFSLGSTKAETSFKVFIRQGLPGIITAILLSFGRAIGDAASVLFTAGYTDHVPESLTQPAATLPLAIFFQLSSPIREVRDRAFSSALILTLLKQIISITSRLFSEKYKKNII